MTSLSTVFGILPIAIGFGAGAESRRPLGIAVVGGVLFSTFIILLLVPSLYLILDDIQRLVRAIRSWVTGDESQTMSIDSANG